MLKKLLIASLYLFPFAAHAAADLTELEVRWLKAAAPVLTYSKNLNLPIDIIVQPKARPGDVPLAMGFAKGRCKLVLSMRGNPDAENVLAGVPEADQDLLIEAMAAHELAHCWRHAQGAWKALPAGFAEVGEESASDSRLLAMSKALRASRREEAYADLAALAWTRHSNPGAYARVHAWLSAVRGGQTARGGHDTRVWVELARDAGSFGKAEAPFQDVEPVWRDGLLRD